MYTPLYLYQYLVPSIRTSCARWRAPLLSAGEGGARPTGRVATHTPLPCSLPLASGLLLCFASGPSQQLVHAGAVFCLVCSHVQYGPRMLRVCLPLLLLCLADQVQSCGNRRFYCCLTALRSGSLIGRQCNNVSCHNANSILVLLQHSKM